MTETKKKAAKKPSSKLPSLKDLKKLNAKDKLTQDHIYQHLLANKISDEFIQYHDDLIQGSEEWIKARCGLLTASEVKLILTPSLKIADNDKSRTHAFELASQRISSFVEDSYQSNHMLNGHLGEEEARNIYSENYQPMIEAGFYTNNYFGFNIGFSPDGQIGEDGLGEIKTRIQKHQIKTFVKNVCPDEFILQIQTGLLVTQRRWCDFISYSSGLPLFVHRVYPNLEIQSAIILAAFNLEKEIDSYIKAYEANSANCVMTERIDFEEEMEIVA